MMAATPEQVREIRSIAQSAVHKARIEATQTPRDHWRGVALRLGRIVLALTSPEEHKQ